ncbi:MAG: hypothetical protein HC914_17310 [Chloroflexaceae bacterium]|nr:hypothetical protein [Chloroflexaceae bacterium]
MLTEIQQAHQQQMRDVLATWSMNDLEMLQRLINQLMQDLQQAEKH